MIFCTCDESPDRHIHIDRLRPSDLIGEASDGWKPMAAEKAKEWLEKQLFEKRGAR